MEIKTKKTLVEEFVIGAKKGFYISVEMIMPAMVLAYALIQFLKITGLMPIIGQVCAPLMMLFGLPGEAVVALIAAFFAKAAGAATAGDWVYFITFATLGNMGQSATNCMTGTTETTTKS